MAGEEIDATLGVKLGFSTLASAGLGNLVSDVAGIGFAEQLEVRRCLSYATVMCTRCLLCLNVVCKTMLMTPFEMMLPCRKVYYLLQGFVRKLKWAKSQPLSPAQRLMLKARGMKPISAMLNCCLTLMYKLLCSSCCLQSLLANLLTTSRFYQANVLMQLLRQVGLFLESQWAACLVWCHYCGWMLLNVKLKRQQSRLTEATPVW